MNEFRKRLSFTQVRFHCSKQQGRTFHVTTVANSTGEAVVQYFSGQTDVKPDACGSFVKMENDNSRMAGVRGQWGYDGERFPGKWGILAADEDRLYNNSAFVRGVYHWLLIKTPFGQLTWNAMTQTLECLLVISGKSLFVKCMLLFLLSFHWPRAQHVTCKYLPTNK